MSEMVVQKGLMIGDLESVKKRFEATVNDYIQVFNSIEKLYCESIANNWNGRQYNELTKTWWLPLKKTSQVFFTNCYDKVCLALDELAQQYEKYEDVTLAIPSRTFANEVKETNPDTSLFRSQNIDRDVIQISTTISRLKKGIESFYEFFKLYKLESSAMATTTSVSYFATRYEEFIKPAGEKFIQDLDNFELKLKFNVEGIEEFEQNIISASEKWWDEFDFKNEE